MSSPIEEVKKKLSIIEKEDSELFKSKSDVLKDILFNSIANLVLNRDSCAYYMPMYESINKTPLRSGRPYDISIILEWYKSGQRVEILGISPNNLAATSVYLEKVVVIPKFRSETIVPIVKKKYGFIPYRYTISKTVSEPCSLSSCNEYETHKDIIGIINFNEEELENYNSIKELYVKSRHSETRKKTIQSDINDLKTLKKQLDNLVEKY